MWIALFPLFYWIEQLVRVITIHSLFTVPYSTLRLCDERLYDAGAGKSTFIENLGMKLVKKKNRVAVIPVDPSSHISGGSILGGIQHFPYFISVTTFLVYSITEIPVEGLNILNLVRALYLSRGWRCGQSNNLQRKKGVKVS